MRNLIPRFVLGACCLDHIPDLLAQAETFQSFEILKLALQRVIGDLDGEVQDRSATLAEAPPSCGRA